jgi:hypothetical protein
LISPSKRNIISFDFSSGSVVEARRPFSPAERKDHLMIHSSQCGFIKLSPFPYSRISKSFTIPFCVLLLHLTHTSETIASTAMIAPGAADSMTTEQLAKVGEIIIFGRVGGFIAGNIDGSGQCGTTFVQDGDRMSAKAINIAAEKK